ncbi:MAG: lysophospholipid acyltransferase family protein [Saccharofermentanales bacterium]
MTSAAPTSNGPWHRLVNRLIRIAAGLFLVPWYLPKVTGIREPLTDEGTLLVANHHFWVDPIFISYFYRSSRLRFVTKKELFDLPVVRTILNAFNAIPLDRSVADLRASKAILQGLREGNIVGLFPQGTRVKGEDPAAVEPHASLLMHAIRRQTAVVPVSIRPRYRFWGRPQIRFGAPRRWSLREGMTLDREEQTLIGYEIMRRIYDAVDLDYHFDGEARAKRLFDERIEETFLEDLHED